jgi:hypothetical protein
MMKWVLYAFLWGIALLVSMDFAQKSSSGTSLTAYLGINSPLIRNFRARPSGVATTSSVGQ